jgi:hypothetical protein
LYDEEVFLSDIGDKPASSRDGLFSPVLTVGGLWKYGVATHESEDVCTGLGAAAEVDFFIAPRKTGGRIQFGQSVELGLGNCAGGRERHLFFAHFSDFVFPIVSERGRTGIGLDIPVGTYLYFPDEGARDTAEMTSSVSLLMYVDRNDTEHLRFKFGPGVELRNDGLADDFPIDNSSVAPVQINFSLRVEWKR